MATFVHLADSNDVKRIRRSGMKAAKVHSRFALEIGADAAVFCVPVTLDYQATFQWLRELRRRGTRSVCGVQFRIPDDELVAVGRYNGVHQLVTASAAVGLFLAAPSHGGMQVLVRRSVAPGAISRVRPLRQVTGWRFYPEAKGQEPWFIAPGEMGRRRLERYRDVREAERSHDDDL